MRALLACSLLAACAPPLGRAAQQNARAEPCLDPYPQQRAVAAVGPMRVVTTGLAAPWEIFVGPDGWLWVTEREEQRVSRVHPETGERRVLLDLDEPGLGGQGGMLGAVLDGDRFYVVRSYTLPNGDKRTKIERYRYEADRLSAPEDVLVGLAAHTDHQAGRLALGPDRRLYYSIGDQGKNQFDGKCRPNRAQTLPSADEVARQDWSSYEGKILRIELDGSIPADNPLLAGVRSHIYSYGHRNTQGLVFTPRGQLFASEHGPKTDDEINLIVAGKNYGWPHVAGRIDDRAYAYFNWSEAPHCEQRPYENYDVPADVPRQRESEWSHPDFMPPIRTLYSVDDAYPFKADDCTAREPTCWPTIAPGSIDYYSGGLPSWGNALLVPSLKRGSVFVLRLDADDQLRCEPAREMFRSKNRYRDVALAPDRRTLYVITDRGYTSGPTAHSWEPLDNEGAILAFTLPSL
jgi:PQQ-dependent dehydrogenase (s-GDH family)